MEGRMEIASQEKRINNAEEKDIYSLLEFIDKEYFKEFLDRIDEVDEDIIDEAEELLNIDIKKMRVYIDEKIPDLLERINDIVKNRGIEISRDNSLRDVLGNSIIAVFRKIVFVLENFRSDNPRHRDKIYDPNSLTRTIIEDYSKLEEGESQMASYYIDSLCENDNVKLEEELTKKAGYLDNFSEYFLDVRRGDSIYKNYPTGAHKLPYFRFFSELKKGNINKENLEKELGKLEEKDQSGNLVIDKDKIRKSELIKR